MGEGTNEKFYNKLIAGPIAFWFFFACLIFIGSKNFLLFHTGVELFSSIIAIFIFVIAANTYDISKNKFFMFLGIGFFFTGIADIIHAFTYSGMNVILDVQGSINISVQIWIVARYMSSLTLLVSCLFLVKPSKFTKLFNPNVVFVIYLVIFTAAAFSILYIGNFPTCYIDGKGPTMFKVASEYINISAIALVAVVYYKNRKSTGVKSFWCIEMSLFCSIIGGIIFARFMLPYEPLNIVAHALKVLSFYCIYKAIVVEGLKDPYSTLHSRLNATHNELHNTGNMLREEKLLREELEKALISNTQSFELLINRSKNAVIVCSEGKMVYANNGAKNLYGCGSLGAIIGKPIERIIPEDIKPYAYELIGKTYEKKSYIPFAETKMLRASGEVIDVEVGIGYITYRNKPAILLILRDIRDDKKIAKLEKDIEITKEFNRVLTEFFSNISHELKTPLNVILGAIQILGLNNTSGLPGDFEGKLNRYLRTMKQNCYRLLRLVNNLIDQSKLDSGFVEPNYRNCNIVNVVEEIAISVADYAKDRGIELIFDTDVEEKLTAVDSDKIERIMLNLLSNAIKFTNEGDQILVNIMDRQDKVAISVKDTGIGIPEDKLVLIFDRFGQVDKSLTRDREGSGIGLSLVKSLVDMHQGTISVNSVFGEGSEFIIELPVRTVIEGKNVIENPMYQSNVERISIEFSDIYS